MQGQHRVDSSFGNVIANETIPTNFGSSVCIGLSFSFLKSRKVQLLYTFKTKIIRRLYQTSSFDT